MFSYIEMVDHLYCHFMLSIGTVGEILGDGHSLLTAVVSRILIQRVRSPRMLTSGKTHRNSWRESSEIRSGKMRESDGVEGK